MVNSTSSFWNSYSFSIMCPIIEPVGCPAGCIVCVCKERRAGRWCDGWRLSWLRQSQNGMFLILGEVRWGDSRTATLDFQSADFGHLEVCLTESLGRQPWRAMGLDIPQEWNLKRYRSRPAPYAKRKDSREHLAEQGALAEIQGKERVYDLWKKGLAFQEDYKDAMRLLYSIFGPSLQERCGSAGACPE